MFGFLSSLVSRAIPAITGLASRALPAIGKAIAVGKNVASAAGSAVGKAQTALSTAKAVGKAAKGAVRSVSPELANKIDEEYNKKRGGVSISDVVGKADRGLAKASGYADQAKQVLANLPPV